MTGRISVALIAILLGACASSEPEAPAPEPVASVDNTGAVTSSDSLIVSEDDSSAESEIEYVEVMPNNATTARASSVGKEDEIVCRREKQTGSNFSRRVCRRVSDIENRAQDDQGALREMRKIRTGSFNDMQGIQGN